MQEGPDPTGDRILDAAMKCLVMFGPKHASVGAIAREAGVAHTTIYRRWPKRNDLVLAALLREAERLFAQVDRDVAEAGSVEEMLVEGFATIYWFFHTHPLLVRAFETEPEGVLPAVTLSAAPGLRVATDYLAGHLSRGLPADSAASMHDLAELFVRVTHSLLLTPRPDHPIQSEEAARAFARRFFPPMVATFRQQTPS